MTSNGMDTTALAHQAIHRGRIGRLGMLAVTLLLLCCVVMPLHARHSISDSPGVAGLLRGIPSGAIALLERDAAADDARAAAYLTVARHCS